MSDRTRDDVLRVVREMIAERLGVDVTQVQPDTRLLDLPNVDSLRLLQGLLAVESHFGVSLDEEHAFVARTVEQIADLVVDAVQRADA
jgi:acyl carrier protein